jgi:hypothetical protein
MRRIMHYFRSESTVLRLILSAEQLLGWTTFPEAADF